MRNKEIFKLVLAASLLAMTFVLDIVIKAIPGLNIAMPLGGGFLGFHLLPLLLIGIWLGFKYGLASGIIYGVASFFYDGYSFAFFASNVGDSILIILLDYIIPFGGFAVAALFSKSLEKRSHFVYAVITAFTIRWASSTIVGAILWATYADGHEWTSNLLTSLNNNALLYSGVYNITYNITTAFVIIFIGLISFRQLRDIKNNYLTENGQ